MLILVRSAISRRLISRASRWRRSQVPNEEPEAASAALSQGGGLSPVRLGRGPPGRRGPPPPGPPGPPWPAGPPLPPLDPPWPTGDGALPDPAGRSAPAALAETPELPADPEPEEAPGTPPAAI